MGTAVAPRNGTTPMTNSKVDHDKRRRHDLRTLLEANAKQMALAIPKHMDVQRLIRIALTATIKTPKLLDCTQASIVQACLEASQLGLEPDGMTGMAYLVPYKDRCQLIPGYRGLVQLARQSGEISTVQAFVVHEKDQFRYRLGMDPSIDHEPYQGDDDPGKLKAVYAVARFKDNNVQWEVMYKRDIEAIRKRSMAANNGPWVTDYEEMAKKSVIRRLCKLLPLSPQARTAVAKSEAVELGLPMVDDLGSIPEEATEGAIETTTAIPSGNPALDQLAADLEGDGEPEELDAATRALLAGTTTAKAPEAPKPEPQPTRTAADRRPPPVHGRRRNSPQAKPVPEEEREPITDEQMIEIDRLYQTCQLTQAWMKATIKRYNVLSLGDLTYQQGLEVIADLERQAGEVSANQELFNSERPMGQSM